MLSQRSMQRTHLPLLGRPGVALLGFLALGCGQSEGDRCQVDSDCKSGLECSHGETGNGVCKRPGTGIAQPLPDASPDQSSASPEVAPDSTRPDTVWLDSAQPDTAGAYDTDIGSDQASTGPEVEPDGAASYDTSAGPDQIPTTAEVRPDSIEQDSAEQDAASTDTEPTTAASDAAGSEAGVLDSMAID